MKVMDYVHTLTQARKDFLVECGRRRHVEAKKKKRSTKYSPEDSSIESRHIAGCIAEGAYADITGLPWVPVRYTKDLGWERDASGIFRKPSDFKCPGDPHQDVKGCTRHTDKNLVLCEDERSAWPDTTYISATTSIDSLEVHFVGKISWAEAVTEKYWFACHPVTGRSGYWIPQQDLHPFSFAEHPLPWRMTESEWERFKTRNDPR